MSLPHASTYSRTAILLHWGMAVIILALFILAELMENPDMPNRAALYQWHKSFGISILLLTCFRLYWRLRHPPPALPEHMPIWARRLAHSSHISFYILMISIPLIGWAMVSASPSGRPTVLYGIINWPHLPILSTLDHKKPAAEFLKNLHEVGAKILFLLLILHISAAFKHLLIDKDNLWTRIVPFLQQK